MSARADRRVEVAPVIDGGHHLDNRASIASGVARGNEGARDHPGVTLGTDTVPVVDHLVREGQRAMNVLKRKTTESRIHSFAQ